MLPQQFAIFARTADPLGGFSSKSCSDIAAFCSFPMNVSSLSMASAIIAWNLTCAERLVSMELSAPSLVNVLHAFLAALLLKKSSAPYVSISSDCCTTSQWHISVIDACLHLDDCCSLHADEVRSFYNAFPISDVRAPPKLLFLSGVLSRNTVL